MAKDKGQDKDLLGNSEYPEPIDQPATDTGLNSVPPTASEVGSATQLAAFYQDLEDEIGKAHQAVDEIATKAKAYVARFQAGN